MTDRGLELYGSVASEAAEVVLRRYSTSFGLASRLLPVRVRRHIADIYALVRVADEIVDGVAVAAGLSAGQAGDRLDALEAEVTAALDSGYSANLVVHAFAATARDTGFGEELVTPFFASMRADLTQQVHTPESFAEYVYGSAEVVGLMCLAAFLDGRRPRDRAPLVAGARALGAAFQKVNFVRDLGTDVAVLGRSYFPGIAVGDFDEEAKLRILDDLDGDLALAAAMIPRLPRDSRAAVAAAHDLFSELSRRLRAVPADRLLSVRVSVPGPVKAWIVGRATLTRRPRISR